MKQDAAHVHNFWYLEGEQIRHRLPIVGFAAARAAFHRTGHLRRDGQPTTHPTRGGGARASHLTRATKLQPLTGFQILMGRNPYQATTLAGVAKTHLICPNANTFHQRTHQTP